MQEASFALKTNDPAGFNIIDVFAWYISEHCPPINASCQGSGHVVKVAAQA